MGDIAIDALKRLPKWAQHEIAKLGANVESTSADLAKALGATKTRIEVNPYRAMVSEGTPRCFVSEHDTIRFHFGEHRYIDVKLDGDELSIRGDERIVIEPNSSNVITVKPK